MMPETLETRPRRGTAVIIMSDDGAHANSKRVLTGKRDRGVKLNGLGSVESTLYKCYNLFYQV